MKKTTVATVLFLSASTLLSFIILSCCFQEDLRLIVKEATYAIFTGCIFAIPSAFLMLILDRTKNLNAEYNTVYKLDEALQQLKDKLNTDGISLEVIEDYGDRISVYDAKLNQIAVNYCFFSEQHSVCLDAVQNETFDTILTMRKIKGCLQAEMEETVLQNKMLEQDADLKRVLARCSDCTKKLLALL